MSRRVGLRVWWQDQAEYYFVCDSCFFTHADKQWSGGTNHYGGYWPTHKAAVEAKARRRRRCEFCGPGGNGGPAS